MISLITAAEVSSQTREKLIALFDHHGLTPRALKAGAAGVSLDGFRKAYPEIYLPNVFYVMLNVKAIADFYRQNSKYYAKIALSIYSENYITKAVEKVYAQDSVPDATGNDAELPEPCERCEDCGQFHN
jgi:hypothetical protein